MFETSKEKLNINRKIAQKKEIIFVEGDMIIPDAKPDILKPICVSGVPSIYKKEAMEGKVRIDGNINTYIMYLSGDEKGETRGINTNLDFSEIIEIPKSQDGAMVCLDTKVKTIECKIINERKISLKATLEISIQISINEQVELISDINEKQNVQVLKDAVKVNSLIGKGNAKIYGKETMQIDQTDNLAEILKANICLMDKDIKISYNKILAKADVEVKIMYLTEDNRIKMIVGKVPIVGFIDLQDVTENSICEVNYEIRNLVIKPNSMEEHSIYIEIEVDISCVAYEEKEINIIKDVYSPYNMIELNMKQISTMSKKKIIREKNQIRQNISIKEMENRKILDVEVNPMIKNENRINTDMKYECELELKFMLLNTMDSKVETKIEKIPFEFATNILEDSDSVNVNADIEVGAEDYIVQANEEINCNIDVMFNIGMEKNMQLNIIENIEDTGKRNKEDYSVIIYIVKKGDTLWKIAKRFGSTIEDIVRVNGIEDENLIMPCQKIFIPRFYNFDSEEIKDDKVNIIENV